MRRLAVCIAGVALLAALGGCRVSPSVDVADDSDVVVLELEKGETLVSGTPVLPPSVGSNSAEVDLGD